MRKDRFWDKSHKPEFSMMRLPERGKGDRIYIGAHNDEKRLIKITVENLALIGYNGKKIRPEGYLYKG